MMVRSPIMIRGVRLAFAAGNGGLDQHDYGPEGVLRRDSDQWGAYALRPLATR